jgi:hypothetical protein
MGDKVLWAVESGLVKGEALAFFEDDDVYMPGWLEWCERYLSKGYDIVGQGYALYYNVRNRWWSNCRNTRHASLCQTAISCDLLERVCNIIRSYDNQFFDTRLWRLDVNKYLQLPTDAQRMLVGIKGMPGVNGYSGEHRQLNQEGNEPDYDLSKLREFIGPDAESYASFFAGQEDLLRLAGA